MKASSECQLITVVSIGRGMVTIRIQKGHGVPT